MDAVAKDGQMVMHFISEHVENAGVHSGTLLSFTHRRILIQLPFVKSRRTLQRSEMLSM
jgi:hypothetical protein